MNVKELKVGAAVWWLASRSGVTRIRCGQVRKVQHHGLARVVQDGGGVVHIHADVLYAKRSDAARAVVSELRDRRAQLDQWVEKAEAALAAAEAELADTLARENQDNQSEERQGCLC